MEVNGYKIKPLANLNGADLEDTDLNGADLEYADLYGANLKGANLEDANLAGADLRYANLEDADLKGANLKDADLKGANLKGAYLEGAYLEGADLEGADVKGTILEKKEELQEDFSCLIEKIAKDNIIGLQTLETRNSDDLDFYDVSVWCLKKALEDAFIAGMTVGNSINKIND